MCIRDRLITLEGLEVDPESYDEIIRLPAVEDEYVPLLLVVTLQLIALEMCIRDRRRSPAGCSSWHP